VICPPERGGKEASVPSTDDTPSKELIRRGGGGRTDSFLRQIKSLSADRKKRETNRRFVRKNLLGDLGRCVGEREFQKA